MNVIQAFSMYVCVCVSVHTFCTVIQFIKFMTFGKNYLNSFQTTYLFTFRLKCGLFLIFLFVPFSCPLSEQKL